MIAMQFFFICLIAKIVYEKDLQSAAKRLRCWEALPMRIIRSETCFRSTFNKNVTIFLDFFQNVSTAHLSSKCNDPFNNISVFFLNVFEAPS